jgi:hypothetical protein
MDVVAKRDCCRYAEQTGSRRPRPPDEGELPKAAAIKPSRKAAAAI